MRSGLEAALGAGREGPRVGLDRELLHLLAREVPLVTIISAPMNWIDLTAAVAGRPARRASERVVEAERLAGGRRRGDRHHAHVLHTAGDDEVHRSAHHGLGGEVHGLLGRAALTVDRRAGNVLRQARREPARAGDAASLRPDRIDVAEHDVVDRARVDARAIDEGLDAVRAEVGGMDGGEAPPRRPTGERTASTMNASGMIPNVPAVSRKGRPRGTSARSRVGS